MVLESGDRNNTPSVVIWAAANGTSGADSRAFEVSSGQGTASARGAPSSHAT